MSGKPGRGRRPDDDETMWLKFWGRVRVADSGCWEWVGPRFDRGYGQTGNARLGSTKTHRAAYLMMVGPIPAGLSVCHTCDNRPCVRPLHFFLGTVADNTRDMIEKGRDRPPHRDKTHCVNGHELTPDNVYVNPNASSRSGRWRGAGRTCLACQRERNQASYNKHRKRRVEARRQRRRATPT